MSHNGTCISLRISSLPPRIPSLAMPAITSCALIQPDPSVSISANMSIASS